MDVFLLGAGRPAGGVRPTALRFLTENTRALDWQIHSFESVASHENIHFLGGYHVEEVIHSYPNLNVTVVPDWEEGGVLHTLSKAPYSGGAVLIAYSDTVFRPDVISVLVSSEGHAAYAYDSCWENRFGSRSEEDVAAAETIEPGLLSSNCDHLIEFTGLVRLGKEAASKVFESENLAKIDGGLIGLLRHLESEGLTVTALNVAGDWAEFNSPDDVARFILGTKADTLARLAPLVTCSKIGKQVTVTAQEWRTDAAMAIAKVQTAFAKQALVVRSSSKLEDNWASSNAGGFESILNVDSSSASDVERAIDSVICSYGQDVATDDQVLVQEFIGEVRAAGVVFTCSLETGAPYYRFNFDDKTSSTESVTSGAGDELRTVVLSRDKRDLFVGLDPLLVPVLKAVQELEYLLGFDKLDIEFALDNEGVVHVFQVRPITVDHSSSETDFGELRGSLQASAAHFVRSQVASPEVLGEHTIFANMPDWNPAEIIGTRPRPLALSLYRHLITDEVWAMQRSEYGYRDVRPLPLISTFCGQPYVDVRASFNSFIPASLPRDSARRIVDAYLVVLADNPEFHDKVEFDVAFTVWTPDLRELAINRLGAHGVNDEDIGGLESGLRDLTRDAIARLHGDIESIATLTERRQQVLESDLAPIDRYAVLIEDCRAYGTLAFSHAARAGFVATTILRWMQRQGALTKGRHEIFLRSFSTVAGEFENAKRALSSGELGIESVVADFGHLRPGTYDITQPAYWEDCEKYFSDNAAIGDDIEPPTFEFSVSETLMASEFLIGLKSSVSVDELFVFLREAIQARESVKFEFTKNLSLALDAVAEVGRDEGLCRDDMSFLCHADLMQLKLNLVSWGELQQVIQRRRSDFEVTCMVELPPVISAKDDIYSFERMSHQPNFVTSGKIEAEVSVLDQGDKDLRGKVVVIPQADPGFDWLFGQNIGGLITQFGGANSHMAIRAAEIGLPAAIGVGEILYEKISGMNKVLLDCANQTIREVQ